MSDETLRAAGRALTPDQKRHVIERIYAAWLEAPSCRLGQLLESACPEHQRGISDDLFYVEDEVLAEVVEKCVGRHHQRKTKP